MDERLKAIQKIFVDFDEEYVSMRLSLLHANIKLMQIKNEALKVASVDQTKEERIECSTNLVQMCLALMPYGMSYAFVEENT